MENITDPIPLLISLGATAGEGVYLNPGCRDEQIKELQILAKEKFGAEIPDGYVKFLRVSNGAQLNNAYFKEAENLIPENLDLPQPYPIVLGNAGNVDEYIFDNQDGKYHAINMGFPDEKYDSFPTFDQLLYYVMKRQEVIS